MKAYKWGIDVEKNTGLEDKSINYCQITSDCPLATV